MRNLSRNWEKVASTTIAINNIVKRSSAKSFNITFPNLFANNDTAQHEIIDHSIKTSYWAV